jgi:TadE-like protein.
MKDYKVQASMTVEMSFLMPMILFLIMGCIFAVFYYHDKNILSGAAYETAIVGSTKAREKEGIKEGELETLFYQRAKDKCIMFVNLQVSVKAGKDEIEVVAGASRKYMKISVAKRAAVTEPEKKIRDLRRIKG